MYHKIKVWLSIVNSSIVLGRRVEKDEEEEEVTVSVINFNHYICAELNT